MSRYHYGDCDVMVQAVLSTIVHLCDCNRHEEWNDYKRVLEMSAGRVPACWHNRR